MGEPRIFSAQVVVKACMHIDSGHLEVWRNKALADYAILFAAEAQFWLRVVLDARHVEPLFTFLAFLGVFSRD